MEYDAHGNQVLIQSTPPDKATPGTTKYYEIQLSSHGEQTGEPVTPQLFCNRRRCFHSRQWK